jgi:hypothetical protein
MRKMAAGVRRSPSYGMHFVSLSQRHQFMISGVILDFVDAVTETIK